jgi:hypothetical protein
MSQAFSNQKMFWDEQLSIARAVAQQPEPSLAKLHHDILEEVGQRPGLELIEYFLAIVDIPEEERAEYLKYAGFSTAPEEKEAVEVPQKSRAMPALLLADTVANGNSPTVLSFRQAYTAEHGDAPSSTLIEYFLKKVHHVQQKKNSGGENSGGGEEDKRLFAEETAKGSHPTVLRLRKGYDARFGGVPSHELISYFLETLRSRRGTVALEPSEKVEGISDSKVAFAKSAATRNITTILQFGMVYEKLYGEPPAVELIDVFIKNLPKASDETLFESTESI